MISRLHNSEILKVSLGRLMPFLIMFSMYVVAYGMNFPGGGFQAGVLLGTVVVVVEALFRRKIYSDRFYGILEISGVVILVVAFMYGVVSDGMPFSRMYSFTSNDTLLSNTGVFILGFAIFFEVAGSIILIGRHFIDWGIDDDQ